MWTPELDSKLLHLKAGQRKSYSQIADELGHGITKDSAQKRFRKLTTVGDEPPLDGLEPMVLQPPPFPPSAPMGGSGITIVASDFHWPLADPACEEIVLAVAQEHRPQQFILNGDGPDMMSLSTYPHDLLVETWTLNDEREAMWKFLYSLHGVMPEDSVLVETNGNHSGDGRESRWWRYLSERVKELSSLPDLMDGLSYRKVWHPPWSRMELADQHEITSGLFAVHGEMVRSKAGYTARAMMEKWRASLIMGHTHRMGMTSVRVPSLGDRPEALLRAYEGGCMCTLTPTYGKGFDWQQGFLVVEHDEDSYNVVPVHIVDGKAIYNRKVYRG